MIMEVMSIGFEAVLAFVLHLEGEGKAVFNKGNVREKVVLESHCCGT